MEGDETDAVMRRIEDALDGHGTLRSAVYRWFWDHHDWFAERLRVRRPNWPAIAKGFADSGVLDGDGKSPTAETVRRTWWRVDTRWRSVHGIGASGRVGRTGGVREVVRAVPADEVSVSGSGDRSAGDALSGVMAKMNRRSGRG